MTARSTKREASSNTEWTRFSLASFRRRLDDYTVFLENHYRCPFTHSTVSLTFGGQLGIFLAQDQ